MLHEDSVSSGNVLLGNVMCNGSELQLMQCKHEQSENTLEDACRDHAGVICQGTYIVVHGKIYTLQNISDTFCHDK